MTQSERIWRWLGPQTDVLLVVDQGTTLEVIDLEKEKGWYWVVLPADLHGTRRVGWIRASSVEPYVAVAAAPVTPPPAAIEAQREDTPAPMPVAPSPTAAAAAEDSVAITVRHDATATNPADAVGGANAPRAFEDVHFERDQSSIRTEDIERLRVAAAKLKDDPSLVVTIEGHTCNLGTGAHNLALGDRRANAVKDYLVSAGVPAERLLTVSQGEANAEYDNSHEETRRLNRRVALVPKVPR